MFVISNWVDTVCVVAFHDKYNMHYGYDCDCLGIFIIVQMDGVE